jgi:nucleoside-diphosphate-sugar epimerase
MILLTGAGGFVGRTIRREFLRRFPHKRLLALVRRPIEPANANQNDCVVQCDLKDTSQIARLPLSEVTGLIHVASATPASGGDFFKDNIEATANLVRALKDSPVRNVVLISSVSVYDFRTARTGPVLLREDSALLAEDEYGRSKLIQEWLVQAFAGSRIRACILRPSSIYGVDMLRRTLLPIWLTQALRGEALTLNAPRGYRQNFVCVDDVAALVCQAFAEEAEGTFNLFSPDTLELPALAEAICRVTGNRRPVVDRSQETPAPALIFDNSRLMAAFHPTMTPLTEGLKKTAEWLQTMDVEVGN